MGWNIFDKQPSSSDLYPAGGCFVQNQWLKILLDVEDPLKRWS